MKRGFMGYSKKKPADSRTIRKSTREESIDTLQAASIDSVNHISIDNVQHQSIATRQTTVINRANLLLKNTVHLNILLDDFIAKRDEQQVSGELSRVEEAGTEDTTSTSIDITTSTSIDSMTSMSTDDKTSTSIDRSTQKSTDELNVDRRQDLNVNRRQDLNVADGRTSTSTDSRTSTSTDGTTSTSTDGTTSTLTDGTTSTSTNVTTSKSVDSTTSTSTNGTTSTSIDGTTSESIAHTIPTSIDRDSYFRSTPLEIPERSSCPQDIAESTHKSVDKSKEFLELEDGEKLEDLDSSREVTREDFWELEEWLEDMDPNSEKKLDDD
ncbi:hypothetical protein F2Q69_00019819 [Brassica cretica]|uniref:Uncharacterized protein n=1 Tax=Brassica cretica TaxID=69181 RepID=A0A8S9QAJ9_BRACR|nr:hypothetical protein F2Q69_00019819 [Brassica cretica]